MPRKDNIKEANAQDFIALASQKNNFTDFMHNDNKLVSGMLNELFYAKDYYQEIVEKEENRRKPDEEKLKEAKELFKKLNGYYNAIKELKDYNYTVPKPDEADLLVTLSTVRDFGDFLTEGKGQTNYQKIIGLTKKDGKPLMNQRAFNRGLDALEKSLHFGLDSFEIANAKPEKEEKNDLLLDDDGYKYNQINDNIIAPKTGGAKKGGKNAAKPVTKDAVNWLEDWKARFNSDKQALRMEPDYPKRHFARIMAARYLAESDIGYADKLYNKPMTLAQIDAKADELMENKDFKDFIEKISNPQNRKLLATAEKCAGSGHGGGLDKLFIKYLNNKPAAELKNAPELKRYMPTVKDRIESLQKQAAANRQKGLTPNMEVAEILILRNMVDAERKQKKSLMKPIPVVTENGELLNEAVAKLANDGYFRNMMKDRAVLDRISDGHGGYMIERLRELDKNIMNDERSMAVAKSINHGTYSTKMENNKELAQNLKTYVTNNYDSLDANKCYELRNKVAHLLAQQVTLAENCARTRDGESKDIKWADVNKQTATFENKIDYKSAIFPTSSKQDCLNALDIIINNVPSQVPSAVAVKIGDHKEMLKAEERKEKEAEKKKGKNAGKNNKNAENNKITNQNANNDLNVEGGDIEDVVANFKKNLGGMQS